MKLKKSFFQISDKNDTTKTDFYSPRHLFACSRYDFFLYVSEDEKKDIALTGQWSYGRKKKSFVMVHDMAGKKYIYVFIFFRRRRKKKIRLCPFNGPAQETDTYAC